MRLQLPQALWSLAEDRLPAKPAHPMANTGQMKPLIGTLDLACCRPIVVVSSPW
ncbi:hypothetical protein O9929_15245 [Vibrio lentus]|nr:hypothetical protein [Vibrio lentus]